MEIADAYLQARYGDQPDQLKILRAAVARLP